MASGNNNQPQNTKQKMEYRKVKFDVNEIAPDAPSGEWTVSIPRGKCKVQPTKEDRFPMLIVPIRLEGTEEESEECQKALGAELSSMIVFFDDTKARAARMSKLRLRQLCEAADVDLDVVPKTIESEDDLEPLIRALEGKKFTAWTRLTTRKDTGEVTTEVVFQNPSKPLAAKGDDEEEDEDETPRRGAPKGGKSAGKSAGKNAASNGRARR
jgi:hypothetical protein